MKKSFCQIAEDYINFHVLTDFEYRTVLRWFRCSSLYFPTEQERNRALDAFVWLYQNISVNESIHFSPDARNECLSCFSSSFLLPIETAEHLFDDFLHNFGSKKPIIIGIEGLDGSGKTVQANELYDTLTQKGKQVCVIDFPQYTSFFGVEIGKLLSGENNISAMGLDEKSMCLWYALDRWQAISNIEIEKVDYVIFNRYTLSSVVYQSARKYGGLNRKFADWIFGLEHVQLGLPVPDIYIYLDTKTDFCQENILRKNRKYVNGLDVYEKSQDLLSCCHNIYRELSKEIYEISIVECLDEFGRLKSVEQISAGVAESLREYGLYV